MFVEFIVGLIYYVTIVMIVSVPIIGAALLLPNKEKSWHFRRRYLCCGYHTDDEKTTVKNPCPSCGFDAPSSNYIKSLQYPLHIERVVGRKKYGLFWIFKGKPWTYDSKF